MNSPETLQSKGFAIRPEWRDNRLPFVASIKSKSTPSEPAKPSMEQSPLTQDVRPEVFEPKIVGLYRRLFKGDEEEEMSEGFWTEMFLLKPDLPKLREILNDTDPESLILLQHHTQQFLSNAVAHIKAGDMPAEENALDTLTVFCSVILAKKYTNPSSDIIEVLAGLDEVDVVFTALVTTLDQVIRDGKTMELRQKAVKATIAVVSGAYQTVLVSYFINRDFFPALMKVISELQAACKDLNTDGSLQMVKELGNPLRAAEPLLLAGLLANYNKFEVQNQYRIRFADFVNDETMNCMVESISWTCKLLRERYIAIQDDTPSAWSITGTLSYVGLGAVVGAKPVAPVLTEDQQKELFLEQPGLDVASLLTVYDFALSNKLFCHHLVSTPSPDKAQVAPFSMFISFNSYLYQHAYRTPRASAYAYLTLLILLILVEDPTTGKVLAETIGPVRLCRQRPPHLPLPKGDRPYTAAIIDVLVDGINHNLRRKLDTNLYIQLISVLSRLLTYLAKSRTKLTYHWSELWRSLLSFARFLTTYSDDLQRLSRITELIGSLVEVCIIALTGGEAFLPDAAAYDDLCYKLVESGETLTKLRDSYKICTESEKSSINTLISVSQHYKGMIETQRSKKQHLSPREVSKIIKDGYETLSFDVKDDPEQQAMYREAQYKSELKRIARVVVGDAATLAAR